MTPLIKARLRAIVNFHHPGDEHRYAVAVTWELALDRANELEPAGLASNVMALASVTDPDGTPEELLTSNAACGFYSRNDKQFNAGDGHSALRNLHRLSLISHDPNGGPQAVRVHRHAQRAAWEHLDRGEADIVVRVAADGLLEIWPGVENDSGLGSTLRSCAASVINRNPAAFLAPDANKIRFRLIKSFGETGLVVSALVEAEELLRDLSDALGPDHPDTLSTRNNIASWRENSGDNAGALAAFEALLVDRMRVLGPDHPDTLLTKNWIKHLQGPVAGTPINVSRFKWLHSCKSIPVRRQRQQQRNA